MWLFFIQLFLISFANFYFLFFCIWLLILAVEQFWLAFLVYFHRITFHTACIGGSFHNYFNLCSCSSSNSIFVIKKGFSIRKKYFWGRFITGRIKCQIKFIIAVLLYRPHCIQLPFICLRILCMPLAWHINMSARWWKSLHNQLNFL